MIQVKLKELRKRFDDLIHHNGQMRENSDWDVLYAVQAFLERPDADGVLVDQWRFFPENK